MPRKIWVREEWANIQARWIGIFSLSCPMTKWISISRPKDSSILSIRRDPTSENEKKSDGSRLLPRSILNIFNGRRAETNVTSRWRWWNPYISHYFNINYLYNKISSFRSYISLSLGGINTKWRHPFILYAKWTIKKLFKKTSLLYSYHWDEANFLLLYWKIGETIFLLFLRDSIDSWWSTAAASARATVSLSLYFALHSYSSLFCLSLNSVIFFLGRVRFSVTR